MIRYDAIIIGSGQAGTPLAYALADAGWQVALVEREHLGGTCVNTGCTPSKSMLASAQVAQYVRTADKWGINAQLAPLDLKTIVERKNRIIERWRAGLERGIKSRIGVHLYRGSATFVDADRIRVGDAELSSNRIFINTGARALIPPLSGLDRTPYLTNDDLMHVTQPIDHLVILGGGYVAVEFGQMYRRFGSRVTIVHRGPHILSREDSDVALELQRSLAGEGIEFALDCEAVAVARGKSGIELTVAEANGTRVIAGSHFLVAAGRRPNTDELRLDVPNVITSRAGHILVNDRLETNIPGIWALGDVTGGPAFTNASYNDHEIVLANLIDGKNVSKRERVVPYAVFTDPELGRVGMSERQARASGRMLKIGVLPMSRDARAIQRGETSGLMKIIVDADTDRILGATVLSTSGAELVQILMAVMLADAPYTVLKRAIFIHPTLAEGFWHLMERVAPVVNSSAATERSNLNDGIAIMEGRNHADATAS